MVVQMDERNQEASSKRMRPSEQVKSFTAWFDHHPWLYGVACALPIAAVLVLVQVEEGNPDDVRTWVYPLIVLAVGMVSGYLLRHRRR